MRPSYVLALVGAAIAAVCAIILVPSIVALAESETDRTLRDDRIVCARSQGRGFGPRTTIAILPNQLTASALWLGDLDGDGRADPCVDSGTSIVCARQP